MAERCREQISQYVGISASAYGGNHAKLTPMYR